MAAMLLGAVVGLAACAPQVPGTAYPPAPQAGAPALPPQPAREKVALLLPLSGPNAALGQPLLNAAQLALFEQGGPGFEFLPRDTGGTPAGAAAAARAAMSEGARILVGPLTAQETAAVAGAARSAGVPVLPFTNDANQAGPEVWPLGLTPEQQVRRVVAAAQGQGVRRFGLAAPDGALGRQMAAALRGAAQDLGLPAPVVELYPAAAAPSLAARDMAPRIAPAPDAAPDAPPGSGVEMLLLGESGARARDFVGGLTGAGAAVPPLRLAGLAVWAYDEGLTQQPALAGAWFPGPDPAAHNQFESRYQAAFGEKPARVAGVAYDAAALAARAMREAAAGGMPRMPVGEIVLGADGALRLNPGGRVQRALAVYALSPGAPAAPVAPAELPGELGY
ncbi:penicillin-binding protein activator [Roseomonas sp. E05]|uniref:penicillin-binding protein activator n=1 Tax=Roseomonas sp. E05 TaxID=3046310 RepID=UPI0024BBB6BB|nr:penicillin-binding protein activator [Roseomonas sp. E05]MDJ0386858.1 penicillin-binding protein activator [Roseomonas sp. E05]